VNVLCDALGLPRTAFYRSRRPRIPPRVRTSSRRLPDELEAEVLSVLNSERFCDKAPAEVYVTLLDEGYYLCSERTMYRVLTRNAQNVARRQRPPRSYQRPELLATRSNQVWAWDITKLKGPEKWSYFYLYTILDIFSRYIVGWLVADSESAQLANAMIGESCLKQEIVPGTLTLHADRGGPMKSRAVGHLLADLGVTKSHSRPHVSDDNPFMESTYKTLKYRPEFPERFQSRDSATDFCRGFFGWYNNQHHHSGISMLTPSDVHHSRGEEVLRRRQETLTRAFKEHPERFVKGVPTVAQVPQEVWINKPVSQDRTQTSRLIENDVLCHWY
jgi:putative transposase